MPSRIGVVDLFAGPGGLGEGFSSLNIDGWHPFKISISVEKEASAHRTLTLRAFLREYREQHGCLPKDYIDFHAGEIPEPDWSHVDPECWALAKEEARALELGTEEAARIVDQAIERSKALFSETVLIGGPPCQAYSLVGRARSRGMEGYVPEDDHRHFLFREYIRVLDKLRPAAFVMENVKGMLSSTVESRRVFEMLMEDLSSLGADDGQKYELRAIRIENHMARLENALQPSDFIVRAEQFGVPQRRHRVIIIGVRSDLADRIPHAQIEVTDSRASVANALDNLPRLRSGLSRRLDEIDAWRETVRNFALRLAQLNDEPKLAALREDFLSITGDLGADFSLSRSARALPPSYGRGNSALARWLECDELKAVAQHETRGHMPSDLGRYLFAAVFGRVHGFSPKASDYPAMLAPEHRNWHTGIFNDRFRVQLENQPSTTITSHISKDGHYFIHPDPTQCRSLTVREAARLQTFPDDFYFLGNRTQQYVQVGNAVPPLLANQLAELIYSMF